MDFFSILTFPRCFIRPFLRAFRRFAAIADQIGLGWGGLAWILSYLLANSNVLCVKISILSYQNFFQFFFTTHSTNDWSHEMLNCPILWLWN
jgi:hypothetical protein